jgi:hypothetical protein
VFLLGKYFNSSLMSVSKGWNLSRYLPIDRHSAYFVINDEKSFETLSAVQPIGARKVVSNVGTRPPARK